VYVQTVSKSDDSGFSNLRSGASLGLPLFREDGTLSGLPDTGVEAQYVGVANGEAKGLSWIEKGLGDILFWMGRPPNPPLLKRDIDSAAAHCFIASST